jgi:hypothetical protein
MAARLGSVLPAREDLFFKALHRTMQGNACGSSH